MRNKIRAGALALLCCFTIICSMTVMIMAVLAANVNNDFSLLYSPYESGGTYISWDCQSCALDYATASGCQGLYYERLPKNQIIKIQKIGGGNLTINFSSGNRQITTYDDVNIVLVNDNGLEPSSSEKFYVIVYSEYAIEPSDCSGFFDGLSVPIYFDNFVTDNISNVSYMFADYSYDALNLTSFNFPAFIGQIPDDYMFSGCYSKVFVNKESYDSVVGYIGEDRCVIPGIIYGKFNEYISSQQQMYFISTASLPITISDLGSITFDYYTSPGRYVNYEGYAVVDNNASVWAYDKEEKTTGPDFGIMMGGEWLNYSGYETLFSADERITCYIVANADTMGGNFSAYFLSSNPIYVVNDDEYYNDQGYYDYHNGMFEGVSLQAQNRGGETIFFNNFDTSLLCSMRRMFKDFGGYYETNEDVLDLSSFDFYLDWYWDVRDQHCITELFYGSSTLKTIYVDDGLDLISMLHDGVAFFDVFTGCTSLVGGTGLTYDDYLDCMSSVGDTDNFYTARDGLFTPISQKG